MLNKSYVGQVNLRTSLKEDSHKMKAKVISLFMAGIITVGLFSGCSSNSGNAGTTANTTTGTEANTTTTESAPADTTADAQESTSNYVFKLPLMPEPVEVTWATVENWYPNASYTDGLEVWETIGQKTNIKIKFEVLPDAQYVTSMQTRLAAGSDLPDILRVPGGDPTSYGQQGLLIPMNDLMAKYGAGVKEQFEKFPLASKIMRSGDGNYYGIAPIIAESSKWMPNYFVIREDWLNNVGKTAPTTTDEWVDVLKAFRDNDANKDGDPANEIPWGGSPLFFAEAFGLHLWASEWQGGFYTDDAGKVYYQFTDPRFKDFLTFANMMYKERLLDPEYGNPNMETVQAKATKNLVGSLNNWADLGMSWGSTLRASIAPEAYFIPVIPPKGPKGDQSIEGYGTVDMGFAGISKDCKNPEAAYKIMDYMWTEEGRMFLAYGIEGKSYSMVDGKPQYTDEAKNYVDGTSSFLRTLGAWPTIPWVQQEYSYIQQLDADPKWGSKAAETCIHPYYAEPFPALLATKAEQEQLSVVLTDINTYRREMTDKFIMGARSIDEFDTFVAEMNSMGLDKVLEIKQAQWDRTMK